MKTGLLSGSKTRVVAFALSKTRVVPLALLGGMALSCASTGAIAQTAQVADKGDTAWILLCSALVIFMTLPGLALFYGGLVRSKNVLSVLMQCLLVFSLVTLALTSRLSRRVW